MPIETWVFAQDRDAGFHDFAVPSRDVLAFFSEWVGPYAYEKLANVQSNSVSGGMEAASSIFYSSTSVVGDRNVRWPTSSSTRSPTSGSAMPSRSGTGSTCG